MCKYLSEYILIYVSKKYNMSCELDNPAPIIIAKKEYTI